MRKLTTAFAAIVLAVLVPGCHSNEPRQFSQEGISFTYPPDWTMTENEQGEHFHYVSVEKDGSHSSGIMILVVLDRELDPGQYLDDATAEILDNEVYENAVVGQIQETRYGAYAAYQARYTADVLGLAHHGRIVVFNNHGRTVSVTEQEAVSDARDNRFGFDIIENTLMLDNQ